MKFTIPKSHLENLTKKINHIRNKGANITFNILGDTIIEKEIKVDAVRDLKINIEAVEVEIDGKYIINGWRFAGTIEHSEVGNILRIIDSELEPVIPSKYRKISPECEHCHQIRDRKDTYLVYNEETKEFKQVGKTCLRNYTGGLDAKVCAEMAESLKAAEIAEFLGEDPEDMFSNYTHGTQDYLLDNEIAKKYSYGYVKEKGYKPGISFKIIGEYLFGISKDIEIKPASDDEIKEMDVWVNNITAEFGYMSNAKIAWTKKVTEYRDLALIASLVSVYLKDKNKIAANKISSSSEYVGNVGDKITIKVVSYRVLFENHMEVAWHTYADSFTYEIIDDKGNVFILKISKRIDSIITDDGFKNVKPLELVAKVKDHKEYKGVKQNIIERGKVTKWEEISPKVGTNKGAEGFDSFIKSLESDNVDENFEDNYHFWLK